MSNSKGVLQCHASDENPERNIVFLHLIDFVNTLDLSSLEISVKFVFI